MTAVILFFLLVSVAAAFADRARSSQDPAWRPLLHLTAPPMPHQGMRNPTARAHSLFLRLFDHVYGARFFSAQRLGASVISTSVGLLVVVLSVGPSETALGSIVSTLWSAGGEEIPVGFDVPSREVIPILRSLGTTLPVFLLALVNFLADFCSLGETRLVLRLGQGRRARTIAALTVVDLGLTAGIFLTFMAASGYFLFGGIDGVRYFFNMIWAIEVACPSS